MSVIFFFPQTASRRLSTQPNLQTDVWKIRKINWMSSSHAISFKLGEYNLLPSISTLRFRNKRKRKLLCPRKKSSFSSCLLMFWDDETKDTRPLDC